jgi:hypothetical protein
MERGASRPLAFAATISASLLAAVVLTFVTGWGSDDLGAFLYWTLPFAGIVALVTPRAARMLRGRALVLVAALAGALVGTAWTAVVAVLLGPWFLAFGFSVWLAWMAGGAAGLVLGAGSPSPQLLQAARLVSFGTLGLVVLASVLVPLVAWVFADRPEVVAHLRDGTSDPQAVAFVQNVVMGQSAVVSVTQNDPLVLEIDVADDATDEERQRLRSTLEDSPLVERVDD